jgi:hypothetical protein
MITGLSVDCGEETPGLNANKANVNTRIMPATVNAPFFIISSYLLEVLSR